MESIDSKQNTEKDLIEEDHFELFGRKAIKGNRIEYPLDENSFILEKYNSQDEIRPQDNTSAIKVEPNFKIDSQEGAINSPSQQNILDPEKENEIKEGYSSSHSEVKVLTFENESIKNELSPKRKMQKSKASHPEYNGAIEKKCKFIPQNLNKLDAHNISDETKKKRNIEKEGKIELMNKEIINFIGSSLENQDVQSQITEFILAKLVNELKEDLFPKRSNEVINLTGAPINFFTAQSSSFSKKIEPSPEKGEMLNLSAEDLQNTQELIDKRLILQAMSRKNGINTDPIHVGNYLDEVLAEVLLNASSFLEKLQIPIVQDELKLLINLQSTDNRSLKPLSLHHEVSPILLTVMYLDIEKKRENQTKADSTKQNCDLSKDSSEIDPESPEFLRECDQIHNKAIFDSINECLNLMRY